MEFVLRGEAGLSVDAVDVAKAIGQRRPVADDLDEASLVRAAQRGDRGAFGLLYDRYGRVVHAILLARLPPSEVDDLVQEVFLTALDRLAALRDPAAFPGWLAAIARNRAADRHRRRSDHIALAEESATAAPVAPEALAVMAVLRALPDAYRETLVMRLVEGMTGPEIAARTGLTHASVRVNLHRGMRLLRERLAGERR
jgi:RNA polymerase sigma-70 factor, ECF subfamily